MLHQELRHAKRMTALGVAVVLASGWLGCVNRQQPLCDNVMPEVFCNDNGLCEPSRSESWRNCPGDCGEDCYPMGFPVPRDLLVAGMRWPMTSQESQDLGLDLNRDGRIDNKGGLIMQLVDSLGVPIQEHLARRLEAGELGMVVRTYANSYEDDDRVMVRILPVVSADGTLLFDGSDEVMPDPDLVDSGFGCGRIADGELQIDVGHGRQPLRCPFCPYSAALLTFHHLQIRGPLQADSSGPLIIGGAVLPEDLRRVFYPDFVTFVNEVIADGGHDADDAADYFDGNCVELTEHPVCSLYATGVGECDDTADPPVITATELLCNALVQSATSPDLDTDDDGQEDMISVGWEISLVPVTVLD